MSALKVCKSKIEENLLRPLSHHEACLLIHDDILTSLILPGELMTEHIPISEEVYNFSLTPVVPLDTAC